MPKNYNDAMITSFIDQCRPLQTQGYMPAPEFSFSETETETAKEKSILYLMKYFAKTCL